MPQNVESLEPKKRPSVLRDETIERERDATNKPLKEAREFFLNHREQAERAIQKAVETKKSFTKVLDRFVDSPEFAQFFKDPTIQKVFEMHNKGDDRVKSYIHKELCEMLDQATKGSPEQYILRREFFRLAMGEVSDNEGRATRTPEQFQAALKERGLATLGSENIHDYATFFEDKDVQRQLATTLQKSVKKIEEWIDGGSEPLNVDIARYILKDSFQDNPAMNTLRALNQRAKYTERSEDAERIIQQNILDIVSGLHIKNDFRHPLLHPDSIVKDAVLARPWTQEAR